METHKVGVRIPPFWPEDPEVWFAQVEGQFAIAGITADTTKFYYVTSNLEPQYARYITDIIKSPPAENKYEKVKAELVKRLSSSKEAKIKQLLNDEVLGDRKPSEFLRHLRKLAGPSVPDDFIRTLWTGRLPTNLQTAVAAQKRLTLEEVADLADCVFDIVQCAPQVATTSRSSPSHDTAQQVEQLTREVASLRAMLSSERRNRNRSRSRDNNRSRSRSRSHDPSVCWYHNRFGQRATKCTTPCSFNSKSGNASGSQN